VLSKAIKEARREAKKTRVIRAKRRRHHFPKRRLSPDNVRVMVAQGLNRPAALVPLVRERSRFDEGETGSVIQLYERSSPKAPAACLMQSKALGTFDGFGRLLLFFFGTSMSLKKLLRTAHCYLPIGRDQKESIQRAERRWLRRPHEADFNAFVHFPKDQLLLDVGANYGQSVGSMRLFCPVAPIISYEPNAILAAKVKHIYHHDERVEVKAIGLSSTAGTFDLYVPYYRGLSYPGLASLNEGEARDWLSADTVYCFNPKHLTIKKISCAFETLDQQHVRPYFIKIDVQGREYDVLQGGVNTLSAHHPVTMIETPWTDPRIGEMLTKLGYREYVFKNGKFVELDYTEGARPLNTFFITDERRREFKSGRTN
jgi:FkbM family methyltransferase